MATNSFIQVPPDSTGKKLYAQAHTIDATTQVVQAFHLVDHDNPRFLQKVDAQGQANVRFAEGSPSMDAFGNLRVSSARMIGAYEYTNDSMDDLFTDHADGGGTITYQPYNSTVTLTTTSASGAIAERTSNRYHYYQPGTGNLIILTLALGDSGKEGNLRGWGYGNHFNGLFFKLTGTTLSVAMHTTTNSPTHTKTATGTSGQYTITVSDTANLSVGMFGLGDGLTFESKITDITGLVVTFNHPLYDDVAGNVVFVAVQITNIDQVDWNGDKLNGTGLSGMDIDVTKANFYWIDLAWLGVGAVRFGVLAPDGSRVTAHTFKNPNINIGAYMQTGSRPIHYHNENLTATSGSSEMKLICCAVYSESNIDYTYWRYDDIERLTPVEVTTDTHIFTAKPKITLPNGLPNRVGSYPDELRVFVSGGTVKLSIVDDATLSAPTWGIVGAGTMKGDISNSTVTGGENFKSWYLGPGAHNIDLCPWYEVNDEGYCLLADGTDAYTFSIIATKMDGTTVNVAAGLTYRELR